MTLQGPHHVAQKSITTGLPELIYIEKRSVSCATQEKVGIRAAVLNSWDEFRTLTTMIDKSDDMVSQRNTTNRFIYLRLVPMGP